MLGARHDRCLYRNNDHATLSVNNLENEKNRLISVGLNIIFKLSWLIPRDNTDIGDDFLNSFLKNVGDASINLTNYQKKVAQYMLKNYNDAAFYTLEELANKVGVSTTTVIRFARSLGYSGYSEMQRHIQQSIREKMGMPERLAKLVSITVREKKQLQESFERDINNIRDTLNLIDDDKVQQTIKKIKEAHTVYILGLRSSFGVAHFFSIALGQIRDKVNLVHSLGETLPDQIVGAKDGDVCVVFSFARHAKVAVEAVKWLKKQNVYIISISDKYLFPFADLADILLPCEVNGTRMFKNSMVGPFALVNYLASSVALSDEKQALSYIAKNEELLMQGEYFYQTDEESIVKE
jgi:DNA-binding MurR/RpiR family transcriptional regulator